MARAVLLDTGPLGMVTHPRPNRDIVEWLRSLLSAGATVHVPEIADYELRRELIRAKRIKGIARLDALEKRIGYIPLTTAAMRKAAEFWADARNRGIPTADDKALDADMILAAQAVTYPRTAGSTVIATTNVAHLSLFADAESWQNVS
ncbi:MAG TPA: PIN domain-containing protein [Pirellulales bacterium]|jgi:predicted nucleic acid-binding protein|nr:PIN domain-containing protein [Pirellulales bacterium]